jgi:hypothetical protein
LSMAGSSREFHHSTSLNVVILLVTMICILSEIVYLQKPAAALLHVMECVVLVGF